MAAFAGEVILSVSAFCKIIVEKVEKGKHAHHIADVKVRHCGECENSHIEDKILFLYQALDPEREQRQIDKLIYPHRVVRHYYRIGAERVEGGKDDRAELSAAV